MWRWIYTSSPGHQLSWEKRRIELGAELTQRFLKFVVTHDVPYQCWMVCLRLRFQEIFQANQTSQNRNSRWSCLCGTLKLHQSCFQLESERKRCKPSFSIVISSRWDYFGMWKLNSAIRWPENQEFHSAQIMFFSQIILLYMSVC